MTTEGMLPGLLRMVKASAAEAGQAISSKLRTALPLPAVAAACLSLASCVPQDERQPDNFVGRRPGQTETGNALTHTPPRVAETGPLTLTVEDAILEALENNRALAVQLFDPQILGTWEDQERAAFDPVLGGSVSAGRTKGGRAATGGTSETTSDTVSAEVSVEKYLPTGTTIGLSANTDSTDSSVYGDRFTASRLGLTVNQALLQGRGLRVNLASLRQARLDTLSSEYELRGFAEALVANVELAYWDFALAKLRLEIFDESLKLAQQQLEETRERINIGKLAETELAASQAEEALRQEDLINARSDLAAAKLRLLRLLNAPGSDFWSRDVNLSDRPEVPDVQLDEVDRHVEVAMHLRPELNQARIAVQRGELEVVKTRNGLLPRMDLFLTLGKSGYADSFGGSIEGIDGSGYDVLAGLSLQYPTGNRAARAFDRRARLSLSQAGQAVRNLEQLAELDVRVAYIEVNRARQQIAATLATRALQQEKLRSETEKFRVGKSTSLLVGQAQSDLTASRIAEIQAVVNYLEALVELHRQDGSLLDRRGISSPGADPVNLPDLK
jgi:outer membrane protein